MASSNLPAFNELESSYATVFWDQRASGSSQGNSQNSLLTLPQFVEDLDKLVDLISHKYNQPKIFLKCCPTRTTMNKKNKYAGCFIALHRHWHVSPLINEKEKIATLKWIRLVTGSVTT